MLQRCPICGIDAPLGGQRARGWTTRYALAADECVDCGLVLVLHNPVPYRQMCRQQPVTVTAGILLKNEKNLQHYLYLISRYSWLTFFVKLIRDPSGSSAQFTVPFQV
jgi:hypothetical protein